MGCESTRAGCHCSIELFGSWEDLWACLREMAAQNSAGGGFIAFQNGYGGFVDS